MSIAEETLRMKEISPVLAASSAEQRNAALKAIADKLCDNAACIFAENEKDLDAAHEAGVSDAVAKRLKFNDAKLSDCIKGIEQLIKLPDPIGRITLARELDEGLKLYRVSCPIGVIGVIFEARPDAMVQISSLCIKSGNCAVLKGGRETAATNRLLFKLIHEAVTETGLPDMSLVQAEQHSEIDELLTCDKNVDLLIPRGSNAFVRHIMDNTKIPVMGHSDGICHIYVDKDADPDKAIRVIVDAKTQYTAACNATETLLVSRDIAEEFLPGIAKALKAAGVRIHGTKEVCDIIDAKLLEPEIFREYLDLEISIKLVSGIDEAIAHINRYGSHHTDAIITENAAAADKFMQMVDSAGVYQNCSTRFADGFRYGFGAEVGISTSKLHARGPVGLEGLMSYKYKLYGNGDIVADYASGKKQFTHKDIAIDV